MIGIVGVDLFVVGAVVLLTAGVVGSLVPAIPGAVLSLAGVYLYWWGTGYTEPTLIVVGFLTLGGLFAIGFDWLGGAFASRAGGASTTTMLLAGVVGFALVFVAGPLGIILGIGATVFVVEYVRGASAGASIRAAGYAAAGVLASAVVQLLVTASMLLIILLVAL